MSDLVTLVAGVLLLSVGLLALLPYLLKRTMARTPLETEAASSTVTAVVESVMPAQRPPISVQPEDLDELRAHLFGLRMMVGDLTEDVHEVQIALGLEDADDQTSAFLAAEEAA